MDCRVKPGNDSGEVFDGRRILTPLTIGSPSGIVYNDPMTKLLDKGIEAVRSLPADRQDMAGELLLGLAETGAQYSLSSEQLADVKRAIAEANRGEFANDSEMAETWKKFGR